MSPVLKRLLCCICLLSTVTAPVWANPEDDEDDNPYIEKGWIEERIKLPAAPQNSDLIDFYVSPNATTRFQIDSKSITIDKDEVVRYTLVATSQSGLRNTSYEGIRCETYQQRLYAIQHKDGTWSRTDSPWRRILDNSQNRQQAALYKDYFCEGRSPLLSAGRIVDKLRAAGGR